MIRSMHNPPGRRLFPSAGEIGRALDRVIIGQSELKATLSLAIETHAFSQALRAENPSQRFPLGPTSVLILGPTASGKTESVNRAAEACGMPLVQVSAAGLVQSGFVGRHPDDILRQAQQVLSTQSTAPFVIIFIDEIDKIRRISGVERDVAGEGVQEALLSFLDGHLQSVSARRDGDTTFEVDPSRFLWVCAGAFVALPDIVRRRLRGNGVVGFHQRVRHSGVSDDEALALVEPRDLEEFGFLPELIGRFGFVTNTHRLTEADFLNALRKTEGNILESKARHFSLFGIDLKWSPEALENLVRLAVQDGTGVRGLNRRIQKALVPAISRLHEMSTEGVASMTVHWDRELGDVVFEKAVALNGGRREGEVVRLRKKLNVTPPPVPTTQLTNTAGWPVERIEARRREVEKAIGYDETVGSARKWWDAFVTENQSRLSLVLRLAEELHARNATITEFFMSYVHSNTDNIQANLHYLDYQRLKKEEALKRQRRV